MRSPGGDEAAITAGAGSFSRIFASESNDPRVVRPIDWAVLVLGAITIALAGWANRSETDVERWVSSIVDGAPDWIASIATVTYAAGGLLALWLVVLVAVRRRAALLRDVVIAVIVNVVVVVLVSLWVSGKWPDVLPEFTSDDVPSFPILRFSWSTAVIAVLRPALTLPLRRIGQRMLMAMALSALLLGVGTLTTVVGGFGLGLACAAVPRLLFGTSSGIPSLDRVRASLADVGLTVDDLAYADKHPAGRLVATATDSEGPLQIGIYGRDAAESAFASRLWRAMWYREARSVLRAGRRQLVEHEALLLVLADRAGVRVPHVVTAGSTETGDALLVTRGHAPAALADLDAEQVDDQLLDALWRQLKTLHAANLTHGHVDRYRITVDVDTSPARVGLRDFSNGALSPRPLQEHVDVVELLVTTALVAGTDRAIAAAIRNWPTDQLAAALAVMQPAALSRSLAEDVDDADLELDDLRTALATGLQVDQPKLLSLRRFRLRDLVMWGLTLIVANVILSWFTDVDFSTVIDEMRDAKYGWLLVALLLTQLTNVADTVSLMGVVSVPVPFGPTMHYQYATSFVGLAMPSETGRIAMTIRYLQKLGVPTAVAIGQGPFTTVFGYAIDAVLLLLCIKVLGDEVDLADVDLSTFWTLLGILFGLIAIAIVVVLLVAPLRRRVAELARETMVELKGSLTDPARASKMLGGILAKKLLFAGALLATATAYGEPRGFAALLFVNIGVSWFAGMMPVPGGIGVAEAGFVVGLTALGIPESTALAIALTHRLLTVYLPPIVGYFSMKRLERTGYL